MKHKLGNNPQCWSCKFYSCGDTADMIAGGFGWCLCPWHLNHGANGRKREKPLEKYKTYKNDYCRQWIDAESGDNYFYIVTGGYEKNETN